MATRQQRESATKENAINTAILNDLMKRPENKVCADCTEPAPKWASWNLGIFLCIQCSGIHRRIGVHITKVRSVSLDKWRSDWIQSMQDGGGNSRVNKEWEAHLPSSFKRLNSNSAAIELFIRDKYEKELWSAKSKPPANPQKEIQKYIDAENNNTGGGGMSEMSYMSQSTSSYQYSDGGSSGFKSSNSDKYKGFGSGGQTHQMSDVNCSDDVLASAMSSLTKGWSSFSAVTSEYASIAAEKTRELGSIAAERTIEFSESAREKMNEGELLDTISTGIDFVSKKVKKSISKGLGSNGGGGGGGDSDDFFAQEGFARDEVEKSISGKDDFFSGLTNKNASRSSGLKPSQGGKYAGFGPGSLPPPSSNSYDDSCESPQRSTSKSKSKPMAKSKPAPKKESGWNDDWGSGSDQEEEEEEEEEVKPTRSKSKTTAKPKAKAKASASKDDDWDADW